MLGNLRRRPAGDLEERFSLADYQELFRFGGSQYLVGGSADLMTAAEGVKNPIVMACISVRALVFSEIRFSFQRWQASRPGELYGTPALRLLERPWPGASTGDLLARMEVDASLYGNAYFVKVGQDLVRLDPTKVTIATADVNDMVSGKAYGKQLVGYSYSDDHSTEIAFWTPADIVHYRPLPDPQHPFRGASWLNPILPDVSADREMTAYKHSYLRNSTVSQMAVTFAPGTSLAQVEAFKSMMDAGHRGVDKAWRTMYVAPGADIKTLGANLEQLNFKTVQGAGETRIAAAAGVPASILGISEGLAGSALNAGNYTAARRRFADGTMRPLWRNAAGSLARIVDVPGGAELWFDDRDIAFLREDAKDIAEIQQVQAGAIRQLVDAGFKPESVVSAITNDDFTRLEHTDLYSVQLQPPMPEGPEPEPEPETEETEPEEPAND